MRFFLFLSIFLTTTISSKAQTEYPTLTEFVTDNAVIFSSSEKAALQDRLIAYEKENTHQIVVVTIESLNGDTIENYALEIFNRNGIGQKEEDNGILILFSELDREVRIEVGDGFQPIITDAFASRVIRNTMIPEFKQEHYFNGLNAGVEEIIKLIDDPKYRDEFSKAIESEGKMPLWGQILFGVFMTAFFGIFIFLGGGIFVKTYKTLIDIYKGLITGKIGLLTFPFLTIMTIIGLLFSLPFIILPLIFAGVFIQEVYDVKYHISPFDLLDNPNLTFYLVLVAIAMFMVVPLVIAFSSKKPYQALKLSLIKNDKKYMSKHISSSGSSSSSSFSSGSSSSSSFSGGGGSSSGGGASGSW